MTTQLNATQRKIIALAKLQRGSRTRKQVFGTEDRISFNTYANFESGSVWPRAANLRVIEDLLDWTPGAIDEALASDVHAGELTLAHMTGCLSFGGKTSIRDFSDAEYFADLPRRIQGIEDLLQKLARFSRGSSNDLDYTA